MLVARFLPRAADVTLLLLSMTDSQQNDSSMLIEKTFSGIFTIEMWGSLNQRKILSEFITQDEEEQGCH